MIRWFRAVAAPAALAIVAGCLGEVSPLPPPDGTSPSITAEGRPAIRFGDNFIEVFDADGALVARVATARPVDNVLDFDDERILYKMLGPDGRPDGILQVAYLDATLEHAIGLDLRVRSARIHEDGRTVAISTWEGELWLWDALTNALTGPALTGVTPFGIHFEPGGSYRLLVNVESGDEISLVDAQIYDVTTAAVTALPTNGRAYVARWSAPGTIIYGTYGAEERAWEMDVATLEEREVTLEEHAAAQFEAVNIRPGLPPGTRSDLIVAAITAVGLDMRAPFPAGVTRGIWQGYYNDPGNSLTTHTGLNKYAIDFGPLWGESNCGYGSAILAIAGGSVTYVGGDPTSHCCGAGCSGGGLMVKITHPGDYESTYMHNSAAHVVDDQAACQGLHISDMGNSGYSCGSCSSHPGTHLHLRMLNAAGEPVKPEPLSGVSNIAVATGSITSDNAMVSSCDGSTPPPPPGGTCGTECDYCWYGTGNENNCPSSWNGTADGCDCGCQFTDPDCGAAPPPPPPPPPPGSCPSGDGAYCGSSVGLDGSTLYYCASGSYSVLEVCAYGCHVAAPGTADYCEAAPPPPPPPPPPTCGSECDYCWFGTANENACPSSWNGTGDGCDCGCQFTDPDCSAAPPPPPPASCPYGDGLYCGSSVGLSGDTLYYCTAGSYSVSSVCSYGCVVAPPGSPDYCASPPSSCPYGNGWYCGSSVGLDADTLYYCSGGSWSVSSVCPGSCVVAPPGSPDYCG